MPKSPKDKVCKTFRPGTGVGCKKCGWVVESHRPRETPVNILPKKDPLVLLAPKKEDA